ncbi:MAG: hypothetical protein NTW87_36385, partial [Planctomycetota bacterium]|nr:hypothetical protein [Planctomycetota bacterium]
MRTGMTVLTLAVSLCAWVAMAQDRPPRDPPRSGSQPRDNAQRYSIEQAVSDRAQLHTIAFDG